MILQRLFPVINSFLPKFLFLSNKVTSAPVSEALIDDIKPNSYEENFKMIHNLSND